MDKQHYKPEEWDGSSFLGLCYAFMTLRFVEPTLTLIAQILKLGAVIILVQYLNCELTDADERLLRPISGRYRN